MAAIAPRSRDVRDALAPQDEPYVLAELDAEISYRVIGALHELHVASEDLDANTGDSIGWPASAPGGSPRFWLCIEDDTGFL
ncbi:MAG: hypothetical protein JWM77_3806 [Rhodospirillales bacterium]|nr:hypothetical protein [Rhodospirillales bacterium]